jgi:hypothetical protein
MKKPLSIMILAAGLGFAMSANASQFSYDFAEVGYGVKGGSTDVGGEGNMALNGSYALKNPNLNAVASFTTNRVTRELQGGIGYHKMIKPRTDALASVRLVKNNAYDIGYALTAGLRHDFTNDFEGEVSVMFKDSLKANEAGVSDTSITAGSRYHFNREMSAGLGVDDEGRFIFNLRMNY